MKNIKLAKTAAAAACIALSAQAYGAGFQILEQGASNMGTSMAGAVTNANDDSTAAYNNPSAFAFADIEAGTTTASMGLSLVLPTLGLHNAGDDKDYDCAVNSYVPNFFFGHKFTDDLSATLSVTAPFGLESKYEDDFRTVGGMQGMHSYLMTIDVNPSIVYKVTDWLSVSGGISAQYIYCKLTSAHPIATMSTIKLTGSGWGVGGNVGFTVKYAEGGRAAFHWRSAVQQDLDGSARIAGSIVGDITASVQMPDSFNMGVYQKLPGMFDNFAVMLDYAYTRWSTFDELPVTGAVPSTTPENWKDTSRVAFGVHYNPECLKKLILRFGVAYDESPVRGAAERTVRIPCSDRLWYSCGLGYQLAENISFDLAYIYIMTIGNSDVSRSEPPISQTVNGYYYGHIHVMSAQINFKF